MIRIVKVNPSDQDISSELVPESLKELEKLFGDPVVKAYTFPNGNAMYISRDSTASDEFRLGGSDLIRGAAFVVGRFRDGGFTSVGYSAETVAALVKFA